MHKPYTKQAQKVIELTTKAARSMHHNYIGTEHLLLGLLKEGSGVAACVLMDAGVEETTFVFLHHAAKLSIFPYLCLLKSKRE